MSRWLLKMSKDGDTTAVPVVFHRNIKEVFPDFREAEVPQLRAAEWTSGPLWTSMGFKGSACLTMVFSTGCRGISAPAPGAPPPSPSALTLVSAELLLSHCVTPLFG